MEAFINHHQYNLIREQVKLISDSYAKSNSHDVTSAIKALAAERVFNQFEELTPLQKDILSPISMLSDSKEAEVFLNSLESVIIPFPQISEAGIKKLFKKVKKLKVPANIKEETLHCSYIGWNDYGASKKYLIVEHHGKLIGVAGEFNRIQDKGVCTICHRISDVGLFMNQKKASSDGTFIKRGNYICQDSEWCNDHLTDRSKLTEFIEWLY
ncbi:FusB/FusC family EF-G-binding protein [Priestia flexa]|uniref:Elongation factor G-binding protein n=1 Tax=Priestia veravalensis TaxID=1414648 RepID=A0A0V8JMX4_9BACI|nr:MULTISPECIES: FusB/FusC family EF-G-binding protein [Priestia]KSU88393.1 hypothetical protein AS180_08135 [Priestia veravalensis]MCG7314567.1 FusB/FusC family EF-G-binding protein [Priestia flexa]QCS52704.1 elongation factor G-binding protein [Priestia flexa]WEZ06663.1 FusB/FusC family EF-G-binding protein [Priestia flexa]WHX77693.1 FusB/FusC family EF-G-binding protein [Priestia flexa]